MRIVGLSEILVVAALISAVPSVQALHPESARHPLSEDDITGSGCEAGGEDVRCCGARRDRMAVSKLAAQWREMAASLRRQARFMDDDKQREFLARAELYEVRAKRLESVEEA